MKALGGGGVEVVPCVPQKCLIGIILTFDVVFTECEDLYRFSASGWLGISGKELYFILGSTIVEEELIQCGPHRAPWKVLETMMCGKLWNETAAFGLEKRQPAGVCEACMGQVGSGGSQCASNSLPILLFCRAERCGCGRAHVYGPQGGPVVRMPSSDSWGPAAQDRTEVSCRAGCEEHRGDALAGGSLTSRLPDFLGPPWLLTAVVL